MKRILILGFVLAFCSCRKVPDESHPGAVVPLSDEIKDFFYYPKGSYWIFKDSLTGNIDSLAVTDYADNELRDGSPNHEEVGMIMEEYKIDTTIIKAATWTIVLTYPNKALLEYQPIVLRPMDLYLGYNSATTGDFTGYNSYCRTTFKAYTNYYQAYLIDTITYNDVYVTAIAHDTNHCDNYTRNDQYFMCKNTGLIKARQFNTYVTRVWELQRYHINR